MPIPVPIFGKNGLEDIIITVPVFGDGDFLVSALAKEGQPKAVPQQPPAMRVGLKLKQRDILYVRIESAQVSKQNRKDVSYGK